MAARPAGLLSTNPQAGGDPTSPGWRPDPNDPKWKDWGGGRYGLQPWQKEVPQEFLRYSNRRGKAQFPGFFEGIRGEGTDVSLDPRFAVSDRGAGQTAFQGLLGQATEQYQRPQGLLQSAFDEYGGGQMSQTESLIDALKASGRGLRAGDEEALRSRREEQTQAGQQQLRGGFDQLSAANQIQQARQQEGLLGMLPGVAAQAQASDQANANRLLSELGKRSDYDQARYRATLKEAQLKDFDLGAT